MSLGENIKNLRKKRRMSETEVSEATGIPIPNLSEIETGKRTPSIRQLKLIADYLRVTTGYLMRGE